MLRADVESGRSVFVHSLEQGLGTEAGRAIFHAATGLVTVVRVTNGASREILDKAISGLSGALPCWAHERNKRGAFLSELGASAC